MKRQELLNLWKKVKTNADWEIERRFNVTIVDINEGDEAKDFIDEEGKEYTIYMQDIESVVEDFYNFDEWFNERYDGTKNGIDLEDYVTKKLVKKIDVKNN